MKPAPGASPCAPRDRRRRPMANRSGRRANSAIPGSPVRRPNAVEVRSAREHTRDKDRRVDASTARIATRADRPHVEEVVVEAAMAGTVRLPSAGCVEEPQRRLTCPRAASGRGSRAPRRHRRTPRDRARWRRCCMETLLASCRRSARCPGSRLAGSIRPRLAGAFRDPPRPSTARSLAPHGRSDRH